MKILVTSHGELCRGIVKSYEMIAGIPNNIVCLELKPEDTGEFRTMLSDIVENEKGNGLIILCDILGGTPYNESYQWFLKYPESIRVVSGLNLGMLIESSFGMSNKTSIDDIANIASKSGIESITIASLNPLNEIDIEF